MTAYLFRDDPYLAEADATVLEAAPDGVELDRTVFYASSGGQPGDTGILRAGGGDIAVTGAVHPDGDRGRILHLVAPGATLPEPGAPVRLRLDWERRYRLMRMHSALHLLCRAVEAPVTGGQVADGKGRLDFDAGEPGVDRDAIAERIAAWIRADLPIRAYWIEEAELDRRPELVRTMAVSPPRGQGRVRLVAIGDIDLRRHPCAQHGRDRRDLDRQDREQGQAQSAHRPAPLRPGLTGRGGARPTTGRAHGLPRCDYSSRATPKSCRSIWNRLMKLR
jgi:misacylated tRNA(Ala) deacylase